VCEVATVIHNADGLGGSVEFFYLCKLCIGGRIGGEGEFGGGDGLLVEIGILQEFADGVFFGVGDVGAVQIAVEGGEGGAVGLTEGLGGFLLVGAFGEGSECHAVGSKIKKIQYTESISEAGKKCKF
jgi:hypothetical protein